MEKGDGMSDLISRSAAIMHFVKVSKNYECGLFTLEELTKELWRVPSVHSGKTSVRCGYLGCVKNSKGSVVTDTRIRECDEMWEER